METTCANIKAEINIFNNFYATPALRAVSQSLFLSVLLSEFLHWHYVADWTQWTMTFDAECAIYLLPMSKSLCGCSFQIFERTLSSKNNAGEDEQIFKGLMLGFISCHKCIHHFQHFTDWIPVSVQVKGIQNNKSMSVLYLLSKSEMLPVALQALFMGLGLNFCNILFFCQEQSPKKRSRQTLTNMKEHSKIQAQHSKKQKYI